MYTANHKIKSLIKSLGFNQAKVAKEMGISYSYFTKLLQLPLSPQWDARVYKAINQLLHERNIEEQKVVQWFDNPKSGLLPKDFYDKKEDENEFVRDYKKVVRQHGKFNK